MLEWQQKLANRVNFEVTRHSRTKEDLFKSHLANYWCAKFSSKSAFMMQITRISIQICHPLISGNKRLLTIRRMLVFSQYIEQKSTIQSSECGSYLTMPWLYLSI